MCFFVGFFFSFPFLCFVLKKRFNWGKFNLLPAVGKQRQKEKHLPHSFFPGSISFFCIQRFHYLSTLSSSREEWGSGWDQFITVLLCCFFLTLFPCCSAVVPMEYQLSQTPPAWFSQDFRNFQCGFATGHNFCWKSCSCRSSSPRRTVSASCPLQHWLFVACSFLQGLSIWCGAGFSMRPSMDI